MGGFRFNEGRWYVSLRGGGGVPYARVVVENALGRALRENEIVHHINGDKADDRLENLSVLDRAAHMAAHREELEQHRARARAERRIAA
jgi:hypothetical protein